MARRRRHEAVEPVRVLQPERLSVPCIVEEWVSVGIDWPPSYWFNASDDVDARIDSAVTWLKITAWQRWSDAVREWAAEHGETPTFGAPRFRDGEAFCDLVAEVAVEFERDHRAADGSSPSRRPSRRGTR